jgi:hypothetical protein
MTAAWVDRVRDALGPSGYSHDNNNKFRKSLQTAVLFEAKRSVDAAATHRLKSYQRKYALLQQAETLLDELVHARVVTPLQRNEVLWKTASSRQALDAVTAWKRVKAVERELHSLAEQVRPFLNPSDGEGGNDAPSHDGDAVVRMIRAQYVRTSYVGIVCVLLWLLLSFLVRGSVSRLLKPLVSRSQLVVRARRPTRPTTSRRTGT